MKTTIFIDILLLLGVVYLFSMCSNENNCKDTTNAPYEINHYLDTINNHVILTTVCYHRAFGISINTLELNN